MLPAVRAFHDRVPLTDAELAAVWPLIVLRGAVLVVSGHSQVAIDPGNAYAASGSVGELAMFEAATSVPCEVMHQLLRDGLGLAATPRPLPAVTLPMVEPEPAVIDLSTTSPLLDAGRWTDPDVEHRLAAAADGAVLLRHGEPRLSRTPPLSLTAPETVAVGCTVVAPRACSCGPPGTYASTTSTARCAWPARVPASWSEVPIRC